jgi:hypothetical protein
MAAGSGYGPWVFDIPADPPNPAVTGTDKTKDETVAFESTTAVRSWSDARADVAAVAAVNSHPDVDAQDWSDLKVPAGKTYKFYAPERPIEEQNTKPTTSGNNKQF